MKRREFVAGAARLAGFMIPASAHAQVRPCPPGTVSVSGGSSATTTCLAPPPPAGLPQYMGGMADFEIRNLTGSYAPLVGETMFSVLPAEWRNSTSAAPVFSTWSGGSGDAASMKLYCRGGGHGDSGNNGLYIYNFSGSTRPTGWSIAPNSLSALAVALNSSTVYSDNKPTSVHSYDCGRFDPVDRSPSLTQRCSATS